jgi:hypothetical protein
MIITATYSRVMLKTTSRIIIKMVFEDKISRCQDFAGLDDVRYEAN